MLNVISLMGRMTNKPEIRQANNTTVCRFTLAVQRNRKDSSGQYPTDFIDCVSFGKTAQFIANYFDKGSMAAVCGALQTSTWQDKKRKQSQER